MTGPDRKTEVLDKRLAWVVPQGGKYEGSVFPIRSGDVIGAGSGAQVQLDDAGVQPRHVQLVAEGGTWTLVHIADGRRTTLMDGKPITLGPLTLVFRAL